MNVAVSESFETVPFCEFYTLPVKISDLQNVFLLEQSLICYLKNNSYVKFSLTKDTNVLTSGMLRNVLGFFVTPSNLYCVFWLNDLLVDVGRLLDGEDFQYSVTCPSKPRLCSIYVYSAFAVIAYTLEHTNSVFFWTPGNANSYEVASDRHFLNEIDEIKFLESAYCVCILLESDSNRFSIFYLKEDTHHWLFDSVCQLNRSKDM